jgi:hypothetical protein
MTIQVRGANWDAAMMRALDADPPPEADAADAADAPHRHLHVVRLLVEVVGEDMKRFLRHHGAKYLAHRPHDDDPIVAMISWMAEYFLHLHDFVRLGPSAMPTWATALDQARALHEDTRLILTMQLGYALLLPILAEEATGRPAYPIVHDHNPAVLRMYEERLRRGRPLVLTALTAAELRRCLDSDGILIANIDTSYPGTRSVRPLPFLGGRLTVPVGLLALALRKSAGVQAAAAPGANGDVSVLASPPLAGGVDGVDGLDGVLRAFGGCFERWVTAYPQQWMGWAGLDRPG